MLLPLPEGHYCCCSCLERGQSTSPAAWWAALPCPPLLPLMRREGEALRGGGRGGGAHLKVHPAGVSGTLNLALISALVGPSQPTPLATLTAMKPAYAAAQRRRRLRGGSWDAAAQMSSDMLLGLPAGLLLALLRQSLKLWLLRERDHALLTAPLLLCC